MDFSDDSVHARVPVTIGIAEVPFSVMLGNHAKDAIVVLGYAGLAEPKIAKWSIDGKAVFGKQMVAQQQLRFLPVMDNRLCMGGFGGGRRAGGAGRERDGQNERKQE